MNLFFHLFEVNPPSKSQGCRLVSHHWMKSEIFHVYNDSWKYFKEYYLLVSPLYHTNHYESCLTPSSSYALDAFYKGMRWFWSSDYFSKKAKDYYVSYDALTNAEKAMNDTLLSFSDFEIHFLDIVEAKLAYERKKLFGMAFVSTLLVICILAYSLTS